MQEVMCVLVNTFAQDATDY